MKKTDKEYRPMPKALTIKNSPIDGLGLFATEDIPVGAIFLDHPTHLYAEECFRLNFGGFINHSRTPNAIIIKDVATSKGYLKIVAPVASNDEITVDYSKTLCGIDYVDVIEGKKEAKIVQMYPNGPQRA